MIINEGRSFMGSVLIEDEWIGAVIEGGEVPDKVKQAIWIDGTGKWLIPGAIDDQVHFREPGFTHKGTIETES
ncbi:MAG: dihydroorotase, partial [Tannerella sp.]|nr:dihydroorotase [Tannerella sp.]